MKKYGLLLLFLLPATAAAQFLGGRTELSVLRGMNDYDETTSIRLGKNSGRISFFVQGQQAKDTQKEVFVTGVGPELYFKPIKNLPIAAAVSAFGYYQDYSGDDVFANTDHDLKYGMGVHVYRGFGLGGRFHIVPRYSYKRYTVKTFDADDEETGQAKFKNSDFGIGGTMRVARRVRIGVEWSRASETNRDTDRNVKTDTWMFSLIRR